MAVDHEDLDILYDNLLEELENPTWSDGDVNGDGLIDSADFDLMFAQYGLELELVS